MAVLFFVLATLACTAHCKPSGDPGVVLKKSSEAHANAGDHESKLSPPWIKEMEGYEEDINQALEDLWPFINFLLGSDSNDSSNKDVKESAEDIYSNEMFARWIADDDDSNNFSDDDFKDESISNISDDSIDLSTTNSYANSKDHSMDYSDDHINNDEFRENLSNYFDDHDFYDSSVEIYGFKRIKPEYADSNSSDYLKYDPNDNTNENIFVNAEDSSYYDKIFAQWMTEDDVSNDDSIDDFMGGIGFNFGDKYYGSFEDTFDEEINIEWKLKGPLIRPQIPKINHLLTSSDSSKFVFVLLILNPNFTSLTKYTENSDKPLPTTAGFNQSTTHSLEEVTLPTTTENYEDVIFTTKIDDSKDAPVSITEESIYTSDMTTEIVNTFTTNTDSSIETINTSESTIQDSSYASYMPTETVLTEAVNTLTPITFTNHEDIVFTIQADYIATETVDFEDVTSTSITNDILLYTNYVPTDVPPINY